MKFLFLLLWSVFGGSALANDGFYQGSGSTLKLMGNPNLRVREERLLIQMKRDPECYQVLVNGAKFVEGRPLDETKSRITLGGRVACREFGDGNLRARWHAVAEYDVEVLRAQADVLIGFPFQSWERQYSDGEELNSFRVPGVANFKTYSNGVEIQGLVLQKLFGGAVIPGAGPQLGYTWRTSFEAGRSYHLRTEYDFGGDVSNSFYEGREYLRGERPWFLDAGGSSAAERLIYFLTPIRSWASPPPEKIVIEVRTAPGFPATHLQPLEMKPSCVDKSSLFYVLHKQFPSSELTVALPHKATGSKRGYRAMKTISDWERWMKSLGGSPKLTCGLLHELQRTADTQLSRLLSNRQCVAACGH